MINKNIFYIIWLLGFMSGFTIMISSSSLNFWLAEEQIGITTIGIFALVSLPYAINFIWAPIFDTIYLPILSKIFGLRVSWIICIEIMLAISVYCISALRPTDDIMLFALCGCCIAFFASAQDTVFGALRTELVNKDQQGAVSGIYIFGYRIGMLLSSSGAIYISQYVDWGIIYKLFSITILIIAILLIILIVYWCNNMAPSTKSYPANQNIKLLQQSKLSIFNTLIMQIIRPIGSIKYIIYLLIFLILYRLPDNFISVMINPFLLHIGYNAFEISTVGKFFGIISAIVGGLIASYIMRTKNLLSSLLIFGSIHAIAHIFFIVQEIYGQNLYLLFVVTGFEAVSGGMSMAAYIAFITSLCHGKFKATQYSFFSSMMGVSRAIFPTISGYIVINFGWSLFYLFTMIATIPSLIMIVYLKKFQSVHNA